MLGWPSRRNSVRISGEPRAGSRGSTVICTTSVATPTSAESQNTKRQPITLPR